MKYKNISTYILCTNTKKVNFIILGQGTEQKNEQLTQSTLKQLKKVYENSIKPLENSYKYKELSQRHFGDPEIFTKPLVVLMGPWSGGKSSMINYILGNEYNKNAFKTGKQNYIFLLKISKLCQVRDMII